MIQVQSSRRMKIKMNIVLALLVLVGFGVLIGRLYQLQLVDGEMYQAKALKQQLRPTAISAQRGAIYDRNMKTLAASATVWTVTLSPAELKDADQLSKIADFLAPLLGVEREKIIERGQKTASYYEIIKQKVDDTTADAILRFCDENKINCVNLVEDSRRYYPYGSLASTVLGFTTSENKGAYGIESNYEKVLAGIPGMVVSAKNAKSGNMPYSYDREYEPVDGNSIVLTIDEVIQHSLERHLETAVIEHNVNNRAVGIAMDVNTGAILGMATKPDFDPNEPNILCDPKALAEIAVFDEQIAAASGEEAERLKSERLDALGKAQFAQWRNKAISDPYEPGSVFKIITASMALDTEVCRPTGEYYTCPGFHIVAGRRKACWKAAGHGTIDFTQAVKFSCNPAFMMIGAKVGPRNFYDYFERFGLKEPTRIDLPGEADGIFYDYDTLAKETGEELASSSFGQTFKVTPIQICTAVAAAVNGGRLMQPYVVSQVLDPEGNIVSTTEPVVKRQVISEQTSETMRGILEKVVGDPDGSGKNAYVPGYRVGGKTGTSEKLDAKEGGEVTRRIASFMGIAPSNDPQVLVLVILDEPQMQNIYGSVIAAPVVGAIMSDILPYLKVEPQYTEAELSDIEVKVPYVTGGVVHDALSALTARGLSYKLVGDGVNVTGQIPSSGTECPKGTRVILYTDGTQPADPAEVPDVLGLSAQQANRTILNAGFNIRLVGADIEGKGVMAVLQDPLPGTAAQEGTIVTVTFADASDAFTAEETYEAMQESSSEPPPGAASPAGG
ncbi:penicillin-binding transpeptidase domain-containing protein [Yanshouia hominis]|uniref:PASTA domain-containing protein n=1 Tax=Yanshouia hominis TaxID=2763673 RepID=A0ABR7NF69_9FIRM|nr:penicillin-binding transpeptidase domain-containing protein [Yanshouia hominis]MBC8575049.1 PASTA domain-containing protein [Yanshouia hominis]